MDKTRRLLSGLLIVLALPLAILAAVPLAVVGALAFHLHVLWQLTRALLRGAKALLGWAAREKWPLTDSAASPITLAFPPRR